jgi:hypothetical protein
MKHSYVPTFPFSLPHLRWVVCWLCWLFAGPMSAKASATSPAKAATPSLATALAPDGSLRPGVQGSFDARQFRLKIAPDGRPRFSPAAALGAGDASWQPGFTAAGPNYTVNTVVQAGTTLYVGGAFSTVGNLVARNVAKWDGTSWSSLGAGKANGVNGTVYSLALLGGDLYVGGYFSQAGGAAASSIAKWNGTTWSPLGAGLSNAASTQLGNVSALIASGSTLYAAGTFTLAGGTDANNIAKWDGTSWQALGTGVTGTIGSVSALAFIGTDLYVGGGFDYAGGAPASRIAKWNGTSWSSLGSGVGTANNGFVEALLVVGTDLYVGGGFSVAGGVTVDDLAKWNGTTWSRVGGAGFANGNSNGAVTAMAFLGNDLYITGYFEHAYGAVADYLAKWNGTTWSAVGGGLGSVSYGVANTLLVSGTSVYVGGRFSSAGNMRADNMAKWDGTNWTSLGGPSNAQGLDQPVYALSAAGSTLYAGGGFRQAGGAAAEGVARWNGTSWTSLYTGPFTGGMQVQAIAVVGSDVYVGGRFYTAGTVSANNIAKWDGTSWSSLGSGTANGVNGTVSALAVIGTDVYAGGTFTQAGGAPANYIAKWNGTRWSPLGSGAVNGVAHPTYPFVQALAVVGTDLYVGGQFASAGGASITNLARWSGTSWSSLGTGINGAITTLVAVGPQLYAGGSFTLVGGQPANRVAIWNGTSWSSLGTGTSNGVSGYVEALAIVGNDVYVGGRLTQAGSISVQNIAKWNGTTWSSLGTGTNGEVRALAVLGGRVYAGGFFTAVGDESQVMNYVGLFDPAQIMATAPALAKQPVTLYPNPAVQEVTLTLPAQGETQIIDLVDVQGRLLSQWALPAGVGSLTLPVTQLKAGVYLLRCGLISQRLVIP